MHNMLQMQLAALGQKVLLLQSAVGVKVLEQEEQEQGLQLCMVVDMLPLLQQQRLQPQQLHRKMLKRLMNMHLKFQMQGLLVDKQNMLLE